MGIFDKEPESNMSTKKPEVKETDLLSLVQALLKTSEIAAARETRLAKQEELEEERKRNRAAQYEKNRANETTIDLQKQATCKHLKGGRNRRRNAIKDFNVYLFSYIDGEVVIKCHDCKMKWRPTDTTERVVRNGKVYKNHTGIGWREALNMVSESTNTPSSSEIPQSQWHKVQRSGVSIANTVGPLIDTEPIGDYVEAR
jgi:hypothetical protein